MNKKIVELYHHYNHTVLGNDLLGCLRWIYSRDFLGRKLKISNKGSVRFMRKDVEGGNNTMNVGRNTLLNRIELKIKGSNNKIVIGENCTMGKGCRIYMFGNNVELVIGNNTSISHDTELLVQENGKKIIIGENCMFSHHINVRTSDAHPVFEIGGGRINHGKDVNIGNHVWITAHCIIQKGVSIGNGAIVATCSVVTKDVPDHSIVAGLPAKVVKEGIDWGIKFDETSPNSIL